MKLFKIVKDKIDSPVRKNIIVHLLGVGINLLSQVILVPFYIIYWGNDLYADWIVISALSSFFNIGDIGMNAVIQNQFSIKYARRETTECVTLLTNNIVLVSCTFIISLIGTIVYILCFDISDQLSLSVINRHDANFIFIILIVNIFLNIYSSIENAIYQATHRAAKCNMMDNIALFFTTTITFVCVLFKIPLTQMVVYMMIPTIFLILFKRYYARRLFRFSFKFSSADFKSLRSLIVPSFGFMLFPIGNAIVLQGFTLIVNRHFGSNSVVLYNTTRTMCNFIKSVLNTIRNSVWPEFSIAYGEHDYKRMRALHRNAVKTSVLGSIAIGIFLLIFGPFIYSIWTQGKVEFDYSLMLAFIIVLIINNIWNSSSVTLISINNHTVLGLLFVIFSLISLLFAGVFGKTLVIIVYCMLLMDFVLSVYTVRKSLMITEDNIKRILRND